MSEPLRSAPAPAPHTENPRPRTIEAPGPSSPAPRVTRPAAEDPRTPGFDSSAPPSPVPKATRPERTAAETPRLSFAHLFVQDLPKFPSLAALHALTDLDLPSTDDQPLPDGMHQRPPMTYTCCALMQFFRDRSDVCVRDELRVYTSGRPEADGRVEAVSVVPDILVSFGVEARERESYVLWKEGKPPDFVMEVASKSMWKRDRDEKPGVYASMGVGEYFLYDPVGGMLEPRLQGHALRDGTYERLAPERLANGEWGVRSEVLGLCAYLKGPERKLRWYDPVTGKELEEPAEVHDRADAAEVRAAEEIAAREAAEARAAEEVAAREAAEERAAAEAAVREEEIAELRAQLRRLQRGAGT